MRILREALESIAAHAHRSLPHECCGILLAEASDPSVVTRTLRATNAETAAPGRRYVLGHEAHLKALDIELAGGARIVGYYHSHPHGDARPSPRDTQQAAPDVTYLIVGLRDGSIHQTAWRLQGDELLPQRLEVAE